MTEPVSAPRRFGVADSSGERHADWLELFFDLVFVVAVAELAATLEHHPTGSGFVQYTLLFVPVWWAWVGYTFYADRLQTGPDVPYRILMIVAMLAVAALAVAVPDAFHGNGSVRFALCYVAVRAVLIILYARAFRLDRSARPLTGRYLIAFTAGAGLWLTSAVVPAPGRYALWAAGLLIELAVPLLSARAIARVPFHVSHIPERFGLFVIIVLGEAVALGAMSLSEGGQDPLSLAVGAVGFLIVGALWWLYFDGVDGSSMRHWWISGQVYVYGHFVVYTALTAFGVGVLLATHAVHDHAVDGSARWALCGGIGAFLLAIGVIQLCRPGGPRDRRTWVRLAAGALFLLLRPLGAGLPLLALELLALALLTAQIVAEHRLAAGQKA
ncbi:low temperature requirement protein LtrA [Actinoplanes octamycinicus]|uniref:Low temperature requirement protein LtrA n=1 Tax=Actinoplanes octamycinicus TaxID=135948 RepID=A0A7W7H519_9ACTN|nr:low temperature requirement protein A [Actinoplanes octamycinicus]MBB4744133.1 low temperature requirement protein LtrA [Actinoplanes octamycinicus]GIE56911.1 membrane protein [Actinoplanes octamycinicus]